MGEVIDLSAFSRQKGDGLAGMEFVVDGIACGGCIGRIEAAVAKLPGVVEARLNFTNRRLSISWRQGALSPAAVVEALERLGYRAHPFARQTAEEQEAQQASWLLRCLAVAGFAAMNIMLLSVSVWSGHVSDMTPETRDLFHWLSALIAMPAAAYAGQPFFRSALSALKARSVNMDVPISLGILLALGMSLVETINHAQHAYFDSAVMLIFFLLCGRYLDHAMRQRTRAVAGNLSALKAEFAHKFLGTGEVVQVPVEALRVDDRILLRPGDRVPADGVVISGKSDLDQSLITGETHQRDVTAGAEVYAGSVVLNGTLTMRVMATGGGTLLDEIDRLLDKAVKTRSRYVRLADKAAGYYAPVVHTAAALTLAGWLIAGASAHDAILIAISVLIITCPCALALAIPAVQVVTAGRMFRSGIFLNAGDAIERLARVDTIVFDKTGTLTLPEPRVVNLEDIKPQALELAGRLALASRHPLAVAVARHARDRRPIDNVREEPGQGIAAQFEGTEIRLGSPAFCGLENDPALAQAETIGASVIAFQSADRSAVFIVHQSVRPGAQAVMQALTKMGLKIVLLSGDRHSAVAPVARTLGLSDWHAGLKPADKVAALEALKREGRHVLMVGDGINDAPALAAAEVSMSPITAADLSQAQADVVFVGEALDPVLEAVTSARKARAVMAQNLMLAVLYNIGAVPIAMAGLVTPLIAAIAMSGSSIIVTLNALRMRGAWLGFFDTDKTIVTDKAIADQTTAVDQRKDVPAWTS